MLLFYRYTTVENPAEFVEFVRETCQELDLFGRILIAEEGINGTVSGVKDATAKFMERLQEHPVTSGMEVKIEESEGHAFKKLSVKHLIAVLPKRK